MPWGYRFQSQSLTLYPVFPCGRKLKMSTIEFQIISIPHEGLAILPLIPWGGEIRMDVNKILVQRLTFN